VEVPAFMEEFSADLSAAEWTILAAGAKAPSAGRFSYYYLFTSFVFLPGRLKA
jgi:hypothetical protein